MTRHAMLFVLMCAATPVAIAEPLEVTRWKAQRDKDLQLSIDAANKKCGTSITGKFDWSAVKYEDFDRKLSAPRFQVAPNAVEHACATGDDAKAAVRTAIKTIVIKPQPGKETRLELKDGELDLIVVPDNNVLIDTARQWVLKHL